MRSVPPRGSGWVLDSVFGSAEVGGPALTYEGARNPTRYRVVVLTSCHAGEGVLTSLLLFQQFFPLGVNKTLPGFVDAFVSMRAEKVALRLCQVKRQIS